MKKEKLQNIVFWLWLPIRFSCWIIIWIIKIIATIIVFVGWGYWAAVDMWENIEIGL